MATHRPIVISGAHVECYVNGRLVGRVTSFQMNSSTPYKSARGIDVMHTLEKIVTTTDISFSLGLVRTMGDGGAQGAGITSAPEDISLMKYFTVLLKERRTDLPVFKADLCVCTAENWSVDAKGRMTGSVSCEGITWSNETTNAL